MKNKSPSRFVFFFTLFFYSTISCAEPHDDHNSSEPWIEHQNLPIITAVLPEFFPPFYYTDPEGMPYGMAIEVLKELEHNTGYQTKFIVKKTWAETFKAIESGEAEVIPSLGITDKRKKYYFFTRAYAKTDVNVFTRTDFTLDDESQLTGLNIAVVKLNIGLKVAENENYKNVQQFDSLELALNALINNKVDALLFPKVITHSTALSLNIKHLIKDTNITLKTIHRAVAVSKKHPEIFEKINTALDAYLKTRDYRDTYFSWYGREPISFSNTELIFINLIVLIFTIAIFNLFWKKRSFSISGNKDRNSFIWLITLISILISAASIVTISTLWILYETSFNEQRIRLIDNVKSRARLIEAIARHDVAESKKNNKTSAYAHAITIKQIISAHKNFRGLGKTGEFTLARKQGGIIKFILRQRHFHSSTPMQIPSHSKLAIPMQLALLGRSGTVIGKDYRNEDVLSAYEPVNILNLGIVAKIDLTEIREPFIRSALFILIIVIVVSLLGSLLFFFIINPIIKKNKETEQRFHQIFLNNHTPVLLVDADNAKIIDANTAAIKYYGYTLEEIHSYKLNTLCADPNSKVLLQLQQFETKKSPSQITQHRIQNGNIRDVQVLMSLVKLNEQNIVYCTIIDITKKLKKEKKHRQLEKDLDQARKMEALGQLTGGISHDFNNMLGIIMGFTELAREKLSNKGDDKITNYLDNVMSASNRAKELIASMMLFSRTNEGEKSALRISSLVNEDIKMLRSIIPTSIFMESHIEEILPATLIEPVKLQQLIMNLCVNARDAMDNTGTLNISLQLQKNINLPCRICHKNVTGNWIDLSISDTGSGMSEEIVQHLFEPFYTTKSAGKGTGMGMAVVHGIVQDLDGHIMVDTKIGQGTTVHVLFKPIGTAEKVIENIDEKPIVENETHNEKILIVDDEKGLSELLGASLEAVGYQCTCFTSSTEALAEFIKTSDKFDLIISDQTMPELTGLEMVKKIREIKHDIPVIIATGYSDVLNEAVAKENNIELLKKPVAREALIKTVNKVFK